MNWKLSIVVAAFAAAGWVTVAQACDNHGQQAKQAKADAEKQTPCGSHKGAELAADKDDQKAPCSKKCDKKCNKNKDAQLAADKEKKGGCPFSHGHDEQTADAKKEGCSKKCSKQVDAALASMPSMKYRVGEETTCCAKSAAAMAQKQGKPMQYVVGDKTFEKEQEAKVALATMVENHMDEMQHVQYVAGEKAIHCAKTAANLAKKSGDKVTYRVAGVDFESQQQAEKAAEAVQAAAKKVKMDYKVGDKHFCCDKMATAEANKNGGKLTYVVGEQETADREEAHQLMVQAQVRAMVEAASEARQS